MYVETRGGPSAAERLRATHGPPTKPRRTAKTGRRRIHALFIRAVTSASSTRRSAPFPLLLIPGGGLNSTMAWWANGAYFNPMEEFSEEFRCITMDLRNAITGESTGPLEHRPAVDARRIDQLGLMTISAPA